MLSARRREPLMEAAAEISGKGGLTDVRTVDATDPDAIQQHLSEVVQRHGPVSLMFNAVSWDDFQGQPFTEMPFDLFFAPVRLGLTSWFHTGTALAKHMAQHGGG
ncbi:MAG TPA: SDR family NAD(P)-dependent oxidoreductase, partial [Anaerolineales bacterium]|nr:SDR family NAD(P)-dependent oxidoreductase [Anaerolineales bacterium]